MARSRYLAVRRHPLALCSYLFIGLLGALFVLHVFQSQTIDLLLGSAFWRLVWEWELVAGGSAALLGCLWRGDLDTALIIERAGATSSAFGLLTYAGGITWAFGWSAPTWLLLGSLAIGCGWRSLQITFEIKTIDRLVKLVSEET